MPILRPLRQLIHSISLMKARRAGLVVESCCYLARDGSYTLKAGAMVKIAESVSLMSRYEIIAESDAQIHIGKSVHFQRDTRIEVGPGGSLYIGDGSWFGHNTTISALKEIRIGKNCLFAPFSYINDNNHQIEKGKLIKDQGWESASVSIGDDVWQGVGATILKGAHIGEGAVIGARSVVNKIIPAYEIWAGVPARKIGERH